MFRTSFFITGFIIILITAFPVVLAFAQASYTGCGGVASPPVSNAAFEQTLVELVNSERASNGNLPPLKRLESLDQAARYYAIDMAFDNYFQPDHGTYDRTNDNSLYKVCDAGQRLATYYSYFNGVGENIASGQITPEEVMQSWMGSPGHRNNILSTNYKELGVGYWPGGLYGSSWVQDFGWRNNVFPLIINREAGAVQTRNVNLYIYGQGSWTEMRLRNDNLDWGVWQPFKNEISWTLENVPGIRTVWIELRQGTQTYTTNDTIFYNVQPAPSMEFMIFLPFAIR